MITLFVGRFQPFHLGHLSDVKKALEFSSKLIIGVGSSQESYSKENPLSYKEREKMIRQAINEEVTILPIDDINDDEKWVDHVISLTGHIDVVYTGNDWVARLFSEKGYEVRQVSLIEDLSSTEVRSRMLEDKDWKSLVPADVYEYLVSIEAQKRVQKIND